MTRALPPGVQPIADTLVASAAYLWSTVRAPGSTCAVCVTPIDGGSLCSRCHEHSTSPHPVADLVGSLVYAPYQTQSYHLVKHYKGKNPGPSLPSLMASLLAVGLRGHIDCLLSLSNSSDIRWCVVPSTRERHHKQPLRVAVQTFARLNREFELSASSTITDARAFDPSHFIVPPGSQIPDSIVLIEDSWVGGGHAQSAASALKMAGVRHVSIFNAARVLDPRWQTTERFMKERAGRQQFIPTRCPWTYGVCPL